MQSVSPNPDLLLTDSCESGNCENKKLKYSLCRMLLPDAGDMRSPVLRHRFLVPYVPLRTESSANVLHWYAAFAQRVEIQYNCNYLIFVNNTGATLLPPCAPVFLPASTSYNIMYHFQLAPQCLDRNLTGCRWNTGCCK